MNRLAALCAVLFLLCASCAGKKAAVADYSAGEKRNIVMASAEAPKGVATCPTGMVLIPSGPTLIGPPE